MIQLTDITKTYKKNGGLEVKVLEGGSAFKNKDKIQRFLVSC